jgi:hypothetical protein
MSPEKITGGMQFLPVQRGTAVRAAGLLPECSRTRAVARIAPGLLRPDAWFAPPARLMQRVFTPAWSAGTKIAAVLLLCGSLSFSARLDG